MVEQETNAQESIEEITTAPEEEQIQQPITKKQIKERLALIKKMMKEEHPVNVSPKAHIEQDKLLKDVLEAIVEGAKDADGLAKAALAVYDLEFTRLFG